MEKAWRYVIAHWRGQLSLPVSYWVNMVLIQRLFKHLTDYAGVILPRGMAIAFACCMAAAFVWSFVGAWRSATCYSASSTRVWGYLAQSTISVGLALSFAYFFK